MKEIKIDFKSPSEADYIGDANPFINDESGHWSPHPTKFTGTKRDFYEQYPLTLDQVYKPMKFRASSAAALFTGRKIFTNDNAKELARLQQKELDSTNPEIGVKLLVKDTDRIKVLCNARDSYTTLPVGAINYVREQVDKEVYEYEDHVYAKQMEKGHMVEDEVIELYNLVFFKSYKKCEDSDYQGANRYFTYHPDVLDKTPGVVVDAKASWNKKTFPKSSVDAYDSGYDWQTKVYLYSMRVEEDLHTTPCSTNPRWTTGRVFFGLCDTPVELLEFSKEDMSLHEVNHLPLGLRATWFDVTLTDDDICFMESRAKAGQIEAERYRQELLSKI